MTGRQVFSGLTTIAAASALLLASVPVQATIVERVVAVVGDRPILLSDLRKRTKPFAASLPASSSERAAARTRLFSEMLDRMVDEELLRRAAARAQVTVSREEVEAAMQRVARGNGVTMEELLAEVERSGVSLAQYRTELRRQLLDAKVINLRLQGRIRVSEEDMRSEYQELIATERQQLEFRAAMVRILLPEGSSSADVRKAQQTARRVIELARKGEDFSKLSRTYSTDPELKKNGGLMPRVKTNTLPPELSRVIARLEIGEVSGPIRSGDALIVTKLLERGDSQLPAFEKARPQMQQRVQLRKMEKARRNWLDGLRKQMHVEIRL